MNMLIIDGLITDVNARASKLYLYRQELQKQLQELQQLIMKTEIEMVKTDGELEAYKNMSEIQREAENG